MLQATFQRAVLLSINGITKLTFKLFRHSVYHLHHWVTRPTRRTLPLADSTRSVINVASTPVLTPLEAETIAVAEQVSTAAIPEIAEAVEPSVNDLQQTVPDSEPIPQPDQATLVQALLDEAWSLGHTTYPKLIDYVKRHTGKGCSKRVIANWKRDRGLIDQAKQVA